MPADENSKQKIKKFLESHAIAVLSTIAADNKPYSATIYVVIDDEYNFYFITRNNSQKIANINANNNASLTLFDPNQPVTIQAQGTIEKVENPDTFVHLFVKMAESSAEEKAGFHWPPPITKIDNNEDISMYKIKPYWLRLGDFTATTTVLSAPEEIFKQIIP